MDWLEIDFGREAESRCIELATDDDGGVVEPPSSSVIQQWNATDWLDISHVKKSPE